MPEDIISTWSSGAHRLGGAGVFPLADLSLDIPNLLLVLLWSGVKLENDEAPAEHKQA